MILGISYYDVYYGIEIQNDMINVTTGQYPFDLNQKFFNAGVKLIATDFVFNRSFTHSDKLITHVIFKEIISGKRKMISILQVLESIKQGRTKFSL